MCCYCFIFCFVLKMTPGNAVRHFGSLRLIATTRQIRWISAVDNFNVVTRPLTGREDHICDFHVSRCPGGCTGALRCDFNAF